MMIMFCLFTTVTNLCCDFFQTTLSNCNTHSLLGFGFFRIMAFIGFSICKFFFFVLDVMSVCRCSLGVPSFFCLPISFAGTLADFITICVLIIIHTFLNTFFTPRMKTTSCGFDSVKFGDRLDILALGASLCYNLPRHGFFPLTKRLCLEPVVAPTTIGSLYFRAYLGESQWLH